MLLSKFLKEGDFHHFHPGYLILGYLSFIASGAKGLKKYLKLLVNMILLSVHLSVLLFENHQLLFHVSQRYTKNKP